MTNLKKNQYISFLYGIVFLGSIRYFYWISSNVISCDDSYSHCFREFFNNDFEVIYILFVLPLVFVVYSFFASVKFFLIKDKKMLFGIKPIILLFCLSIYTFTFSRNYIHFILLISVILVFIIQLYLYKSHS